jgi:hypothetical protein
MNRKWLIASILIVILIVLCGASLYVVWQGARMMETSGYRFGIQSNAVMAEGVEEKTLTLDGPANLTLNNDFGDVSVKSGVDGQIQIKAEKTAWGSNEADAQRMLEELKVVVEQSGNTIMISVKRPEEKYLLNLKPGVGSVKFTITVPEETTTNLNSVNGSLTLSGTKGNANLQTHFGNITISDITGAVIAKAINGSVSAKNIASDEDVTMTSESAASTRRKSVVQM